MASKVVMLFDELHKLIESRNDDADVNKNLCTQLITELSGTDFWVHGEVDDTEGKQLLGLTFGSEPEISNKPILMLWVGTEPGTFPPMLEGASKDFFQCIPGVAIVMLTNTQRFDMVIVEDNEEPFLVKFEILRYAITLFLLRQNKSTPSSQTNDYYKREWPTAFCNHLYKYCCDNKNIGLCNVGLINVDGTNEMILIVDFKCDYPQMIAEHDAAITKIGNDLLPATMSLNSLSPDSDIFNGKLLEVFKLQPPFYKKDYNKNIWGRIKRRLSPPKNIVLTLNLGDAAAGTCAEKLSE